MTPAGPTAGGVRDQPDGGPRRIPRGAALGARCGIARPGLAVIGPCGGLEPGAGGEPPAPQIVLMAACGAGAAPAEAAADCDLLVFDYVHLRTEGLPGRCRSGGCFVALLIGEVVPAQLAAEQIQEG